uniref:RRP12 HEAT domain-containing protein n=1 Tax=Euplotes harpa TaxID=151035 RepID=A0A7S3N6U0_9SPIT|mmetsp:Transcript_1286/g.1365  ORF Transcript_1286/g.1365 Transcript_1286/m.1365 type:complete len:882 (+) Transcript_1286:442-3087(+)
MKLLDFDLNSESYSFDSKSYLLPVIKKHAEKENFTFFLENFMPLIDELILAKKELKSGKQFIKEKKYETLILQIWEVFPNYCHNYESDNKMLQKLLTRLDTVIKNNLYSARVVALKNYCAMIDYFKSVPKENLIVKKARVYLIKKAISYINTLSGLYLDAPNASVSKVEMTDLKEQEYGAVLTTISKFGWLAKRMKLYDLFFNELTNIVQEFTEFETGEGSAEGHMDTDANNKSVNNVEREETKKRILRKIDIIICLMERIKLSKAHCTLIVNFADSISKSKITQKKAFKILAIILSNFEMSTYAELKELFSKLTGYAFNQSQQKQKLIMLRLFLNKIKKPKKETDNMEADEEVKDDNDSDQEDEEQEIKQVEITDEDRVEITTTILPEVITGFCSLQTKSKKLSELILIDLIKLHANHFNDFIKKLLAGFAGDTVETRSSTIEILTKVLKSNHSEFTEANLKKIVMITVLFLKEHSTHLQKCVLKLLKRILSVISKEAAGELCSTILAAIVSFEGKQKLSLRVKYLIKKLIKMVGKDEVKRQIPPEHIALVDYTDKMMRREQKKIQKSRELIAEDEEENERKRLIEGDRIEEQVESDQGDSSSDDESDDDANKRDREMIDYDIPIVRNLKEINTHEGKAGAKEEHKEESKKDRIDRILTTVDDEFSSHFYDNPVLLVKKRKEERKRLEEVNRKQKEKEERIRNKIYDDDEDDLFYDKNKKFIVKDVEANERAANQQRKRKRDERDELLTKMLPKDVQNLIELEEKAKSVHKRQKVNESMDVDNFIPLHYLKSKQNKDKTKEGHIIKQSGAAFRGKNSKSDVLKKGEHEPYAYIKLNPKMINKRNRDKAVKSFQTVVEKKKQDKRKQKDGMLSGVVFKSTK